MVRPRKARIRWSGRWIMTCSVRSASGRGRRGEGMPRPLRILIAGDYTRRGENEDRGSRIEDGEDSAPAALPTMLYPPSSILVLPLALRRRERRRRLRRSLARKRGQNPADVDVA